jgi:multidrug transporter EmrE-like cation transporter
VNKWIVMAFCAMFLNGVVLTTQKLVPVAFTNHFLALAFAVGGSICWATVIVLRRSVRAADFALGAAAGVISYIGNVFLIRSLSMGSASLVFPIVFGTSMVIVTLASALAFKERLTPRGICAVIVGIASVVVLKLS